MLGRDCTRIKQSEAIDLGFIWDGDIADVGALSRSPVHGVLAYIVITAAQEW